MEIAALFEETDLSVAKVDDNSDIENQAAKSTAEKNGTSKVACNMSDGDKKLETLEKVMKMLKRSDSKNFVAILEKVMIGAMTVDADKKNMFYEMVSTFLEVINDCRSMEELVRFKDSLKLSFQQQELKKITIDHSCVEILVSHPFPFVPPVPRVLGVGAFSTVLKGRLKKPNNATVVDVAVKVANLDRFDDMIMNEAKILADLKHPNIIKVLGFMHKTKATTSNRIVLEFMSLGNLSEARENCSFSNENVLHILRDVASALEYMAAKKYIHRDVACRNVFINSRKQTKLADFGLAQYVGDSGGVYKQEDFTLSSYNISPESFLTQCYRMETDIWAFGLLIWELHCFLQKDQEYMVYMNVLDNKAMLGLRVYNLSDKLPKPSKCPLELYKFVKEWCMCKDYEKRPNFTAIKAKIETFMKKDNKNK